MRWFQYSIADFEETLNPANGGFVVMERRAKETTVCALCARVEHFFVSVLVPICLVDFFPSFFYAAAFINRAATTFHLDDVPGSRACGAHMCSEYQLAGPTWLTNHRITVPSWAVRCPHSPCGRAVNT